MIWMTGVVVLTSMCPFVFGTFEDFASPFVVGLDTAASVVADLLVLEFVSRFLLPAM